MLFHYERVVQLNCCVALPRSRAAALIFLFELDQLILSDLSYLGGISIGSFLCHEQVEQVMTCKGRTQYI